MTAFPLIFIGYNTFYSSPRIIIAQQVLSLVGRILQPDWDQKRRSGKPIGYYAVSCSMVLSIKEA